MPLSLQPAMPTNWWDIDQEKQWCFLLHWCLNFLRLYKQELSLTDLCFLHYNTQDTDQYHTLEKRMITALYQGRDFETTDQAIKLIFQQVYDQLNTTNILQNNSRLRDFFEQQDLNIV